MAASSVIGVDMGGTKLLAGALGPGLEVHHRVRRPTHGLSQEALLATAVEAVEEARAAAPEPPAAVGFGIPCTFDRRTGKAVVAINLDLADVAFADVMTERLGIPVVADNDANMATLAEHRLGAARGANHVVMLTVGTGIGGGLILDGRLYEGAVGAAAELGHCVIAMDGPRCQGNCPNRGCLESLASGTALTREAQAAAEAQPESELGRALASGREVKGALVTELAHDGDVAAREVLALIGRRLGVGVANYVNVFNPEVVVLGGGVMGAGELILAPARAEMLARALPPARDLVQVVGAALGGEAGMIGAGALAQDWLRAQAA